MKENVTITIVVDSAIAEEVIRACQIHRIYVINAIPSPYGNSTQLTVNVSLFDLQELLYAGIDAGQEIYSSDNLLT